VAGFILSFAVPVLIFPLRIAVPVAVVWGILLLAFFSLRTAKIKNESSMKLIIEHILIALFVIFISYWVGNLIAIWLG
jgi:VIT1/CCC1 family predicted Fe2+/Mn2+ transporter